MLVYIIANVVNVILQTIRSLATVKCGKTLASITNALAYGFYTFVIVLTAIDGISIITKCAIVGATNLVGVFAVKLVEEKLRKDRLWKIEATCSVGNTLSFVVDLREKGISHNYYPIDNDHYGFNIYAKTQSESEIVKALLKEYNCKYFASESKIL